eukprot:8485732-Alexandrium_andersonii.AAC.1
MAVAAMCKGTGVSNDGGDSVLASDGTQNGAVHSERSFKVTAMLMQATAVLTEVLQWQWQWWWAAVEGYTDGDFDPWRVPLTSALVHVPAKCWAQC